MKVAFTGKGGVGKTTLASLFIRALSQDGKEVLAVDCDPDSNLGRTLGFEGADTITPIVHMKEMIHERMGVKEDDKTFYKLNPKIDDIPDKFSQHKGNIKLIVMGTVEGGDTGCMCPENTFVKNLIRHLILRKGEHLVMDMEAGVEHFGRGTAGACDFVLTVVEPSLNSIATAKKISGFAKDIGIKKVYAIGNKIRSGKDTGFIKDTLGGIKVIETIDFDAGFLEWGKGTNERKVPKQIGKRLEHIKRTLQEESN